MSIFNNWLQSTCLLSTSYSIKSGQYRKVDILVDECNTLVPQDTTTNKAPYLFPSKVDTDMPRELNPNHDLAVATIFCVQGDSVWVSGPNIRSNLQK